MNTTPNSDKIRDMAHKVTAILFSASDKVLAETWTGIDSPNSDRDVTSKAMVRGWVMDEIESRLGAELFDAWLCSTDVADGFSTPDPASYLARARQR